MPPIKQGTNFKNAAQTTHVNAPGKLSIQELSSIEQISPAGKEMADRTAPRSAFQVPRGTDAPAAPGASANGASVATEFTSASTQHGLGTGSEETVPPLMSDRGKKLAAKSAPTSV